MPERVFKYSSFEELKGFAASLEKALTTGNIQQLRNNHTGFLVETAPLTAVQIRRSLMDVRYEIFKRGCEGNADAKKLEPCNPLREKSMQVHSRSAVGTFGYPLPAPLVPPEP